MTILTIIIFLVILTVVVIVHELGHFVTARLFGVRVKEFGIGMPPKALDLFKFWGTQFTLNWLPLGGFVNLEGENEDPSQEKNTDQSTFYCQKAWRRFTVILAGPVMNMVLAMGLFMVVYGILGIPQEFPGRVFIDAVQDGSPAANAGIPDGVQLLTLRGETDELASVTDYKKVTEFIAAQKGKTVTLTTTGVCEQGRCEEIEQVFQAYVRTDEEKPAGEGALGVALTEYQSVFYPWYQQIPLSIYHGAKQSWLLAQEMIVGLGRAIAGIFTDQEEVVMMGPVGIVSELNKQQTFSEGLWAILQFTGLISLNLGIVNLLPIPALDGGRLLLIALEKIIGRAKIAKVEAGLNYFGFIFVMGLALLITGSDVWRLIKGD